jgi:hypothetical protein
VLTAPSDAANVCHVAGSYRSAIFTVAARTPSTASYATSDVGVDAAPAPHAVEVLVDGTVTTGAVLST